MECSSHTHTYTVDKGFTLIELLVTIVIIGILATISVTTFNGYFSKARAAKIIYDLNSIEKSFKFLLIDLDTNKYPTQAELGYHGDPTISQLISTGKLKHLDGNLKALKFGNERYSYDN